MDEAERREVSEFFRSLDQETEGKTVTDLWQSLSSENRKQILLAEYRCRHSGCLLLSVFRLPGGRYFYTPPTDLPPAVARDSTAPAARAKHTSDGFRRWNGYAGSLDRVVDFSVRDVGGLHVDCPHVRDLLLTATRLDADTSCAPGRPAAPILLP